MRAINSVDTGNQAQNKLLNKLLNKAFEKLNLKKFQNKVEKLFATFYIDHHSTYWRQKNIRCC
jgi:hypothetical protein